MQVQQIYILIAALVVVCFIAAAALGLVGGGMGKPTSTMSHAPLPDDDGAALDVDDVRALRFDVVARGYRMSEVDAAFERIAADLDQRVDLRVADREARLARREARVAQLEAELTRRSARVENGAGEALDTALFLDPEPPMDPEPSTDPEPRRWPAARSWPRVQQEPQQNTPDGSAEGND